MKEKIKESAKKDCCVACGVETEYYDTTHIDARRFYIEGAGQLCKDCFEKIINEKRGKEEGRPTMRIVGIIGPYFSSGDRRSIDYNIANAQFIAIRIAEFFSDSKLIGFFCPHSHTARFEKLANAKEEYYHTLDDAIYDSACEIFVLLPGWEDSKGSVRDVKRAKERKRRFFLLKDYSVENIRFLLQGMERWARRKMEDERIELRNGGQ